MPKYSIILADPPWSYKVWSRDTGMGRSAESHYPCMSIEDIYKLPVKKLAEKDCVLFLWVTFPLLEEGLKTIRKWKFKYKTCAFTWVKKNKVKDSYFWGLGYWTRANAELCLLATRGNPKRISKGVHQIVDSRIREHSQKPDIVRERIVQLCGDLPRIELFAREKVLGWDSWGNEINSDISFDTPKSLNSTL